MNRRHTNSGAPAEILVAKRLLELGYIVSFPFTGKASYDLVADNYKSLLRVQVKTIYHGKTDNGKRWTVDFIRGQRHLNRKYTSKDCDFIVAACPLLDVCYVFPIEDVKDKRQATFYFDDKPHPNARGYEWVEQYKEKWF